VYGRFSRNLANSNLPKINVKTPPKIQEYLFLSNISGICDYLGLVSCDKKLRRSSTLFRLEQFLKLINVRVLEIPGFLKASRCSCLTELPEKSIVQASKSFDKN